MSTVTASSPKPASSSWKPGDPVVFGSSSVATPTILAANMQQQTLKLWSKSAWQPGMPVDGISAAAAPKVARGGKASAGVNKRDAKAKKDESSSQRVNVTSKYCYNADARSRSSLESFWAPSKKRSDKKATPPKPKYGFALPF